MKVGIGYSDVAKSLVAGHAAAEQALHNAKQDTPCDAVLLFNTASHNQAALRQGVVAAVGEDIPVYGGGSVGIITNDWFGYAGNQVGVVCLWMEGQSFDVFVEKGLQHGEKRVGELLGLQMEGQHDKLNSPLVLFYDAINNTSDEAQLFMADWLLQGIEKGLGHLPLLAGAGLQGDHVCTPASLYTGKGLSTEAALALRFPQNVHMDVAIMHGCRPASGYYTVTKAEGPVILEINGVRAIEFLDSILGPGITPEQYPFFLILGVNQGDRWGEYDEDNYASRLCFGLDKERGGIVMFEPDMVAGTEFQLMLRTLDPSYMVPKIEGLFDKLEGREPVFALYIDCAGRCAGYGGLDIEDAVVLQRTIDNRVPLFGLYTGAEIAPMRGKSRSLDWTGVLCLFSQSADGNVSVDQGEVKPHAESKPLPMVQSEGEKASQQSQVLVDPEKTEADIPVEALLKLTEQDVAKILELDSQNIATRHELEHKRRSFSLLSEFALMFQGQRAEADVFQYTISRINASLNMQKTVILVPEDETYFIPKFAQGYKDAEFSKLREKRLQISEELLNPINPVLITAADPDEHYAELRTTLGLPYFMCIPIIIKNQIAALLITGRMVEQPPFLTRLSQRDVETMQAVGGAIASTLIYREVERTQEELVLAKESAEENSRAKSIFLANMSHELRTPLNAIVGMAEVAKSSDDPDRIDYCLNRIDRAAEQLLGVISDVLDMSKISAGKFTLSPSDFFLDDLLQRVVNVTSLKAEEKEQSLSIEVDEDVPKALIADELRLGQVMINLLSNAVKFTNEQGKIHLKVHKSEDKGQECVLHFEVIDNGIGIAQEQQDILFDSFVQADGGISRKFGGTGLGLAISKDIVEMMQGRIWVESELGAGSNFQFTIRAEKGTATESKMRTSEDSPVEKDIFIDKRVLLAEDIEVNREVFIALFEDTGLTIDCVENGREAVEAFTSHPAGTYDLIFMDIQMPEMDGYEAARAIRASGKADAATIPIVAMTANVFKEDIENCLAAGMDDHVGKPLNIEQVMATLKWLLKEKDR